MRGSWQRLVGAAALVALAACAPARTPVGSATVTTPADVGPMSEKDRYEAERWSRGEAGLHFDTPSGLVEVEALVAASPLAASQHLERAAALFGENRIVDALEQYNLAARNDPRSSAAFVGIGLVMKRRGDLARSLVSFRTALDRDGANLDARYQLALLLWSAARPAEAVAEMDAVVAADDSFGPAHERLAVWHYYAGDIEAARRHFERAKSLGQEVPAQLSQFFAR